MKDQKPKVIVTRRLPAIVENRMKELFDVELNENDIPMSAKELAVAMGKADILVPTISDTIDSKLLARAGENLRLIASYGAGFDHIDVQTARQRGILVSNTPGVLTDDTADMTLALMLGVMRRFQEGASLIQKKSWDGWSPSAMLGTRLGGKRLGILGMGRIGSAVATRAKAFGMEVCAWSENLNLTHANEIGVLPMSKEDLLKNSDIISIHLVLGDRYKNLITKKELGMMKKTAFLINTSRGLIINENDLVEALKDEKIAGVGLDVYDKEPLPQDHKLRFLPNALLLPHIGYVTAENYSKFYSQMIENLESCLKNKPLRVIS